MCTNILPLKKLVVHEAQANEILDEVVSKTVGELADVVIVEQDEVMGGKEVEWCGSDGGDRLEKETDLHSENQEVPPNSFEIEQTIVSTKGFRKKK